MGEKYRDQSGSKHWPLIPINSVDVRAQMMAINTTQKIRGLFSQIILRF